MVQWTSSFTIGVTSGEYLQTPITPSNIHSRDIDVIIPQSTFVSPSRLELETPALKVRCSKPIELRRQLTKLVFATINLMGLLLQFFV